MKLCPICDRELTVGNYCRGCKKIVSKPITISDGIYLNKSHYGNDGICEFHKNDRKVPIINSRHASNEINCSYHNPEDYNEHNPKNPEYKIALPKFEKSTFKMAKKNLSSAIGFKSGFYNPKNS